VKGKGINVTCYGYSEEGMVSGLGCIKKREKTQKEKKQGKSKS